MGVIVISVWLLSDDSVEKIGLGFYGIKVRAGD
jgi:hypothetical protein